MIIQLNWITCGNNHWCNLKNLDLTDISDVGVYIIWHTGEPSRVVRVGQGNIKNRLSEHRKDDEILAYGELRVIWATVALKSKRDGIERHLAEHWKPLIGHNFPNVAPIDVNCPFFPDPDPDHDNMSEENFYEIPYPPEY